MIPWSVIGGWLMVIGVSALPVDPVQSPDQMGFAIAEEADLRDRGFCDTQVDLTMTLIGADGRERQRRMAAKTLEGAGPGIGEKSLIIFHEPKDVRGTAFLSHAYAERDDDQWLYLPSLKRVKRIAASNKSGSFVGSEFSYEDLLARELNEFDYLWLRDEPCSEWRCFVIEQRPRDRNSGYSRLNIWIDHENYRPFRIDYFDREDRLLKTLEFADYRKYLDRFWRPQVMRMSNQQSGRITILEFGDYGFRTGLGSTNFEPSALRRIP